MNRYDQKMQELKAEFWGARDGYSPIYVTEAAFAEVEKTLGEPLPADYREFLRDYGVYWVKAYFPLQPNEEAVSPGGISWFKGILNQCDGKLRSDFSSWDLLETYENLLDMIDDWPEDWICIADGDSSDFYALSFKGENKGKVYYIADASIWPRILIADSFGEFINLVRRRDRDDE